VGGGHRGRRPRPGRAARPVPPHGHRPPLRHHIEDVAELVPHLITRLTRGQDLTCAPDAMRVLMRNRWPGNVEQLYQVLPQGGRPPPLRRADRGDLPPEARAVTRRVLTRWRPSSATRSWTR
jgi:transcriptional regulator with GAF, ATPase, and Fis domain